MVPLLLMPLTKKKRGCFASREVLDQHYKTSPEMFHTGCSTLGVEYWTCRIAVTPQERSE